MSDRPAIPGPMKRAVRQRCGFGCVVCGDPIYDYDHIINYADEQMHEESNLTLLCDKHHREKDAKLLPLAKVQRCNQAPYNLNETFSPKRMFHFEGRSICLDLGDSRLTYSHLREGQVIPLLVVDNNPLLSVRFEGGQLLLSIKLYNDNGELALHMVDNQLVVNLEFWDIEVIANRLTIRTGLGEIFLKLEFNPPSWLRVVQGVLQYNGWVLVVQNGALKCLNHFTQISGIKLNNCPVGFGLGDTSKFNIGFNFGGEFHPVNRTNQISSLTASKTESVELPPPEFDDFEVGAEPEKSALLGHLSASSSLFAIAVATRTKK